MNDNSETSSPPESRSAKGDTPPEWARPLRNLYQSVVDEPLPDSFAKLLAKLDEAQSDGSPE